jgi:glycerophosphoryl diester phosphodiesterase
MTSRLPAALLLALLLAAPAAAAQEPPAPSFIHAHRGAHTLAGSFEFGEETLSSFRHAQIVLGSVIELDAKLTADGVPVVIHDATLDRTTPCTGEVRSRTLAQLAECPVDVLGSPGGSLGGIPTERSEPIPTLAEALSFVRESGATANLEIKNVPTEADFDEGDDFAHAVMDVVIESGVPVDRIILQSFWPQNLDVAEERLPGAQTALLTQGQLNPGGSAFAAANGYEWVSPAWPVDAAYVTRAHAAGRRVVPYTLNTPADVEQARAIGVDAVITDDPLMARRALGIPDPVSGDITGPTVTIRTPELVSKEFRTRTLRLKWRGEDPAGLAGFEAQLRRAGARRWRTISLGGRPAARFVAKPGASYDLRVRAQDNFGNLGEYDTLTFTVPVDERARSVRLSSAWRRVKRANAWHYAVARASRRGATASLSFTGTRLRVIGPRLARGGRFEVAVDGVRRTISTRGRGERRVLFDSGPLTAGRHRMTLRTLGGGSVMLDAFATS